MSLCVVSSANPPRGAVGRPAGASFGLSARWGPASRRTGAYLGPEPAADQGDKEADKVETCLRTHQQAGAETGFNLRKAIEDLPSAVASAMKEQPSRTLTLELENLELRLEAKLVSKSDLKDVKDELKELFNRNISLLGLTVAAFGLLLMFKQTPHEQAAVQQAKPRLSRLTSLALVGISLLPWGDSSLVDGLPHLTALERLAICDRDTAAEVAGLPAGAWAARLRWLVADWQLLVKSPGLLSDADQLERLVIMGGRASHGSGKRVWDAVAAHPCLRGLELHPTFSCGETFQPEPQLAALVRRRAAAIAARRPGGLAFAAAEDEGALWAGMFEEWA